MRGMDGKERILRCDNCERPIRGEPIRGRILGREFVFCSEECLEEFDPRRIRME